MSYKKIDNTNYDHHRAFLSKGWRLAKERSLISFFQDLFPIQCQQTINYNLCQEHKSGMTRGPKCVNILERES